MKPLTPLLLCLLLFSPTLHSQNIPIKHLKYEPLSINEGLSQGFVNCMLQDRYGFMWFGTKDGLNRYDGYQFTIFRHDARDESSIGGNFIQSLFEDSRGRLWVGTSDNGLDLFERETESFLHFVPAASAATMQSSNESTAAGRITGLSSENVQAINEDILGNIWVCTLQGLDVITMNRNDKNREEYSTINTNIRGTVYGLAMNTAGTIYLTDKSLGLCRVNVPNTAGGQTKEQVPDFHHLDLDPITPASFDFSGVKEKPDDPYFSRYVLTDTAKHQTWFFCYTSFICVDDRTNKVLRIIKVNIRPITVSSTGVIDSGGIMLLGLDYTTFELNTHTGTLSIIRFDGYNDRQANRGTMEVMKNRSGSLWVSTNGYGLLKHNVRAEKFHHTSEKSVLYMAPAPNNCIYISFAPDFWKFDPQQVTFTDSIRLFQLLRTDKGYSLFDYPWLDDNRNRRLNGYGDNLFCYDYTTRTSIEYKLPVIVTGSADEFQQQILEDHSGIFWIATRGGLFRFDEDNQSWKRYTNVEGDTTSIATNILFSLCLDPQQPEKYLWVGTDGGGLNRMDMTTGKFISYTTHDGLPNNVVYGVLNDDEGNLWLSTNQGLSCFDPVRRTFKNYEEKDGLQSNEFNHRAFCRTSNGWLFFGGVNGFNYFNPKDLRDNTYIPDVLITGVRIRNKPVSFTEKNSALTEPAYLTKQITLPYSENMITFEFASMDLSRPGKNHFQYKLEGFDPDWVQSGTNHSATYTNLDPGTYTFLLKGSNSDGIWNEQPTTMLLTILPPWYMTWWFRFLVGATIAVALYGMYRYRLQQALKLQAIRNRIASDLHDEIGSNLSSISIFSQVANEETDQRSPELSSWLKKINEYTQSSLDAINDIVWVINSRNDRFENIISRMRILAAELFEARNCDLQMNFDESLNEVKLGMEERKNFYLIYKEAVNNIVKYANCKTVKIELKWDRPVVHLRISDDGVGFDAATVEHGNGLLNMQKRAETLKGNLSIHSAPGKGTSVELDFNA